MSSTIKCTKCGEEKIVGNTGKYFKSYSPLHESTGYVSVCKDCIQAMYIDFSKKGMSKKDIFIEICKMLDKPFINDVFENVVESNKNTPPSKLIGEFFKQVHMSQWRKKGIFRFEHSEIEKKILPQIETEIEITQEDLKSKQDVIRLMGYDPFAGYSLIDQKFLYNELNSYLDEDTMDDAFKLSQIIQVVNNNNQVRKIDLAINTMSSNIVELIKNQADIKSATAIKNQIVQATDKIAKENSISVKNRSDGKSGKSTLGALMKDLRELNFEKAEHNYYTLKKTHGMKVSADISHKSIIEILNFDTNDEHNLFKIQRELIQSLQEKEIDYKEEIRKLLIKNKELQEQLDKLDTK